MTLRHTCWAFWHDQVSGLMKRSTHLVWHHQSHRLIWPFLTYVDDASSFLPCGAHTFLFHPSRNVYHKTFLIGCEGHVWIVKICGNVVIDWIRVRPVEISDIFQMPEAFAMQTGRESGVNKCSVAWKPECGLIMLMNVLPAAEFLMTLVCKQCT